MPLQGCRSPRGQQGLVLKGFTEPGLRIVVLGGVGIFLGQGIVEMSSIQVGAVGQDLAQFCRKGKVCEGPNREYFVPWKPPRLLALPFKAIKYLANK